MDRSFKEKIYSLTRRIPIGFVATYGQLARLGGKPKAARAVGGYMKRNKDAPNTPCHRVVAKDGSLTGYSLKGGLTTKRLLLEKEEVPFIDRKVDLKKALWSGVL